MEKLSLKNTPKSDHKSSFETELENLENALRTVQLALEILTGACATLPDPTQDLPRDAIDPDQDGEEIYPSPVVYSIYVLLDLDDEDGILDIEMDTAEEMTSAATKSTFLPSLVPPLLSLIHPTSLSFPPLAAPSPHPPTTSVLSAIHISALECMNNIFLSLATSSDTKINSDKESGVKVWNDIWTSLNLVGTQTGLGQERREEYWQVAIGALWGIGTIWKGSIVRDFVRLLQHATPANGRFIGTERRPSSSSNATMRGHI